MKTKIKELRIAAKMTQQELADLVHVSSRTIISIEKDLCCLKENREQEDRQYENL